MAKYHVTTEDGAIYEVETEDTEQIAQTQKSIGEFIGTKIPESTANLATGIVQPLIHPIETTKNIGKLALGVASRAIPGVQKYEPMADKLGDMLLERYGGVDRIKETMYNDPAGFAMDVSSVLTGAGWVAKAGGLAKTANVLTKVGEVTNPLTYPIKATGKAIKTVSAPFRSSLDIPVLKAAERQGVGLPASIATKSPAVQALEAGAGKGLFGSRIRTFIESAGEELNKRADNLVNSLKAYPTDSLKGQKLLQSFDLYKEKYNTLRDSLYGDFEKAGGNKLVATTESTRNVLDDIIKRKEMTLGGADPSVRYYKNMLKEISGETGLKEGTLTYGPKQYEIRFDNLKTTRTDIGSKLKAKAPITVGNESDMRKLYGAISDDMEKTVINNFPELSQPFQDAQSFYKQGLNKLNSEWGKLIEKNRNTPSEIVGILTDPNIPIEEIPKIYEVVGPKNVQQIQSSIIQDIFEGARSKETQMFTTTGISRKIKQYGDDKLKTALTGSQYSVIKDIEILSRKYGVGQKIASGSQTAFIGRLIGELGLAFTNPLLAAKVIVGDAAFSSFVSSRAGQKYLTTGFDIGRTAGENLIKFTPKIEKATKGLYITQYLNRQ